MKRAMNRPIVTSSRGLNRSAASLATHSERDFHKLLRFYKRGSYTWQEAIWRFSNLVHSPEFSEHIRLLPEEVLSELRQTGLRAPSHPEDVFILHSYCGPEPTPEYEDFLCKERLEWYWTARKLREFFFPGLQLPPFEPVKLIGTVEECAVIEGAVVLFGEFQSWLIRKHPVHCVTPGGQKIPITVVSHGLVKHKHEDSPDAVIRRYGRPALCLGPEVSEPMPVGSKVWVDRTAASSIPELDQAEPSTLPGRGGE